MIFRDLTLEMAGLRDVERAARGKARPPSRARTRDLMERYG